MKTVFEIKKPQNPQVIMPLIFDSPHSGTDYPDDFIYDCDFKDLQLCEDHFVDELFARAPEHGGALLSALFPRSYIDPNRAEDDIDLQLLDGHYPHPVNATSRADSGIGLVRRLVRPGVPIYNRNLSTEEMERRIHDYYRPYHAALSDLIDEAHYTFGQVFHINCHSMPSHTAVPKRPFEMIGNAAAPVDFCIGDRDGTTSDADFSRALRNFFISKGYRVSMNDPFKGVEIIDRYSDPARGRHSIQLEINKALYMDEERGEKSKDFDKLQTVINELIVFCGDYAQKQLIPQAAD